MSIWKKQKSKTDRDTARQAPDEIQGDLLRGEEGRPHGESYQPMGYFETPEELSKIGFTDHAGDNFLGVVGGQTHEVERDDGRTEYVTLGGQPVGSRDDRHRGCIAGSRAGKGRSLIIPELLTSMSSMIVLDPKGENAGISSRYRAEVLGHKVYVLDPFGITPPQCELYRAQFNPMTLLTLESLTIVEDTGLISDAIIVATNDKDAHWDYSARGFLESVTLYVAVSENFSPEERTLLTVAELITCKHHSSINGLLRDMMDCTLLDNRIAAGAIMLKEKGADERAGVVSNVRKNLNFLNYDAMWGALAHHDFDLHDLKNEKMTIYLVLPARRMATCKQWLRLFVNLTLSAMEANPVKPDYPVQMILDEMAILGYMKELENAIGLMAGLGLRITFILQDLNQLKSLYKERYETFLGNAGVLTFFGIADYFTSEWVSKYLGKTTIRQSERNATSLDSRNQGASGVQYRHQQQSLMTPEEVRRYFARDDHYNRQLVCIPGKRPYILQRANYDKHELFEGRFDDSD